eukprot:234273_1
MQKKNIYWWLLVYVLICVIVSINPIESRVISRGKARERLKKVKGGKGGKKVLGRLGRGRGFNMREFKRLNRKFRRTKEGRIRYKKKQFYKDIPIFDATIVVEQDNDGNESPILGKYYTKTEIEKYVANTTPLITKEMAVNIALGLFKTDSNIDYDSYKTELYIYKHRNHAHLVWFVNIPDKRVIIDASNGYILTTHDLLINFEACGEGGNEKIGKYEYCEDKQPLQIDSNPDLDGLYILNNSRLTIFNNLGNPKSDFSQSQPVECEPINDGKQCQIIDSEANGAYCVACDVFYQLNIAFNIYDEWLDGSLPVNEEYLPLRVYIHVTDFDGSSYENAGFSEDTDGRGYIMFGDCASTYYPMAVFGISAHELAHGFTRNNSELVYADQSGGMNEAYSDLMAQVAKYYINEEVDWMIGCDIKKDSTCMRYMDDRVRSDGKSIDNYKVGYYTNINPHQSSGVYNKAWWLLNTEKGWDMKTLFEVVSKAHAYWDPQSTYNEGVCGIYEALYEVKGNNSITHGMAYELIDAFEQVGVQCIQYTEEDDDINESDIINIDNEAIMINRGNKMEWIYFSLNTKDLQLLDDSVEELLTITISGGNGDADLYILANEDIWSTNFICISNSIGNDEECVIQIDKAVDCNFYILVYGFNEFNGATLSYKITPYNPTKIVFDEPIFISGDETMAKYFFFEIESAELFTITIELSGGGVDYYMNPVFLNVKSSKLESIEERFVYDTHHPGISKEDYRDATYRGSIDPGSYYILVQSFSRYSDVKLLVTPYINVGAINVDPEPNKMYQYTLSLSSFLSKTTAYLNISLNIDANYLVGWAITDDKYYNLTTMYGDAFDWSQFSEGEICQPVAVDVHTECIVKEPKSEVTILLMGKEGIEAIEDVQLHARLHYTENTHLVTNDYAAKSEKNNKIRNEREITATATFRSFESGVDGMVKVDENGNVFIDLDISNLDISACNFDENEDILFEYRIHTKWDYAMNDLTSKAGPIQCSLDRNGYVYNPFNEENCNDDILEQDSKTDKYFACSIGDLSGRFGVAEPDDNNKIVIEGNISANDNKDGGFCVSRLTPESLYQKSIVFSCKDNTSTYLFCAPFQIIIQ